MAVTSAAKSAPKVVSALRGLVDDAVDTGRKFADDPHISTRRPTAVAASENAEEQFLRVDVDALRDSPTRGGINPMEKTTEAMAKYPQFRSPVRNPEKRAATQVDMVSENLLDLYERVPDVVRTEGRKWYEGANKMARSLASKYNRPPEAAAGVIAALSPQKDWYMNASLADRVMRIYDNPGVFTDDMAETAKRIIKDKDAADLKAVSTKPFEELNAKQKAVYIRLRDETYGDRSYLEYSPSGDALGKVTTGKGNDAKAAWGSFNEISKAVRVLDDPSIDNISKQMGDAHKVRNFYNNIIDPMGDRGDITVDTHAVAAGLWEPLSGNSPQVGQAFGTAPGVASSSITGVQGSYPIYADGYRKAADEVGILPREMQSVTWEGVRSLFPASMKNNSKVTGSIEQVWKDVAQGKITREAGRDQIFEIAGGIDAPSWAKEQGFANIGALLGATVMGGGLMAMMPQGAEAGTISSIRTIADDVARRVSTASDEIAKKMREMPEIGAIEEEQAASLMDSPRPEVRRDAAVNTLALERAGHEIPEEMRSRALLELNASPPQEAAGRTAIDLEDDYQAREVMERLRANPRQTLPEQRQAQRDEQLLQGLLGKTTAAAAIGIGGLAAGSPESQAGPMSSGTRWLMRELEARSVQAKELQRTRDYLETQAASASGAGDTEMANQLMAEAQRLDERMVALESNPGSVQQAGYASPEALAATTAAAAGTMAIAPEVDTEIDRRVNEAVRGRQYKARTAQRKEKYQSLGSQLLSGMAEMIGGSSLAGVIPVLGQALDSAGTQRSGALAAITGATELAFGGGTDRAIERATAIAGAPAEQTEDMIGENVAAATGSPAAGAAVKTALSILPIGEPL
jgi:hypothetical protein